MRLAGANLNAAVHAEDRQITRSNYFIGNDPANWHTDIPNFGRVRHPGIYPGIDPSSRRRGNPERRDRTRCRNGSLQVPVAAAHAHGA